MSTKVKILIGGGGIAPPGMAAPVEIHYKGRPAQPSRGNSVRNWGDSNRDVSGLAKFNGSCFGI